MLFKHCHITIALPLLCATLLLGAACNKTPDATPEHAEHVQPEKPATTAPVDSAEVTEKPDLESAKTVQASAAELRDQFQQEANTSITIENAESVLAEIEAELNEEIAELERQAPPKPAN